MNGKYCVNISITKNQRHFINWKCSTLKKQRCWWCCGCCYGCCCCVV